MTQTSPSSGSAGFLAVIDGPVGVGKTTVTALTAAALAADGLPVLATRQPSDSPPGKLARSATHELRGLALTFLVAADRYYHYQHVIAPALAAGQVVVCDRYVTTALAVQRFHEGGVTAAETEASLYARATTMLAGRGYPIQVVPIGDLSAEKVAATVSALISDRVRSSRTAPEEGSRRR